MIEDLRKDTEDTGAEVPAAATGGAPVKKKKKKKKLAADGTPLKKKKKKKPVADAEPVSEPAPAADEPVKKKKKKKPASAPAPVKKKKKSKSAPVKAAKPKKPKKDKALPVHKEDLFRPDSRLGVAFALLKDGKPHTKKEIAAAIKKKCGSVPWPHRIFGHLRARAAETGKFLLKETERGVFVLTLRK